MVAFSLPFGVLQIVILTDEEPDDEGTITTFGDRGLIYIQMFNLGQNEKELRDFFEGRTSDPQVLRDNNINIDVDEIISRGTTPIADATVMYVVQRGSVSTRGQESDGITSMMLFDCPQDSRTRFAIWFGPDPDPGAAAHDLDLTGTPGDEAEMRSFVGQFRLCE
jgi:hypothetical protein